MAKNLSVKLRVNKSNGQINVNLPKKKMSKGFLKDLDVIKRLRIKIEDWEV